MCSSVFTEGDPGHLIHTSANRAQEIVSMTSILRCEAPWHTPDGPFGAPSDRQRPPLFLHLSVAKVGPGGCTLCVLCHRSTRGALQTRRHGTRVRAHRSTTGADSPRQPGIDPQHEHAGSSGYQETKCVLVCT